MDKLLDIRALAEVLSIPVGSIRNDLWRKQTSTTIPPPIRLGRRLRWSQSVVEAWLHGKEEFAQEHYESRASSVNHRGRPTKRAQMIKAQAEKRNNEPGAFTESGPALAGSTEEFYPARCAEPHL